ncbi:hypothetical protein WMY93_023099 [Mugilogobius chulae]|uniref:Uncharacterized protein n=1 Tax=Mugilogobius chulae TaxID=88201 RepID=A0AAW0N6F3_9GOBI
MTPKHHDAKASREECLVSFVGGQEDGGHEDCVPGFQVKHYQVVYSGPFRKGQSLLQVTSILYNLGKCVLSESVIHACARGCSQPQCHMQIYGNVRRLLPPAEDLLCNYQPGRGLPEGIPVVMDQKFKDIRPG